MKKIFNSLIFILISIVMLSSCTKEPKRKTDPLVDNDVNMRINFKTPVSSNDDPITKSDASVENAINSVYLFLMDETTNQVYSIVKGTNIAGNASSSSKTFEVVVTFRSDSPEGRKYYCYFVTNISLSEANINALKGKNYTELYNELDAEFTQSSMLTNGIVMWGMSPTNMAFTKDATPKSMNMTLLRAIARVDVGLGKVESNAWTGKDKNDALIPFRLTSVHLYRANNNYSYIPKSAERDLISAALNSSSTSKPKVTTPSNTGLSLAVGNTIHQHLISSNAYDTSLLTTTKSITHMYVPEADVIQGGVSFDNNHVNRCAIVIGGFYDDSRKLSYYRVDFNETTTGALMNILRNHQYALSIIDVFGAGYETGDEAYKNKAMNMTVEILAWDSANSDIIFDGANWFSIEKKQIIVGGTFGNPAQLSVSSVVNSADWSFAWSDTSTFPEGSAYQKVDELVLAGIVKVTKPSPAITSGTQVGNLTFTALSTARTTKYLFIKVNDRLQLQIKVDIVPDGYSIDDWTDEGNDDIQL